MILPARQAPTPALSPSDVDAALESACAGLSPEERVRVTEMVARRIRERSRADRWPTPGELAMAVDATVVQTPAMDHVDDVLIGVDRSLRGVPEGAVRRGGIFMPPQEGKSTRVVVHGLAWLLSRHPDLRCGVASYEQTIALKSGRAVRDLIDTHGSADGRPLEDDLLGIQVDPEERAESRWKLRGHRGGVVSVGIGGALTGRPLDLLVIDDPLKDARAADSVLVRQRAWEWYTSVARTRLAPGGIVLVVLTRWHEDDLAGRLIAQDLQRPAERRIWTWVSIPAQGIPPLTPDQVARGALPDALGRPAGEYLESARGRSVADWEETRDEVTGRDWSAMYQQNPTPSEGTVFRWSWLNRNRRGVDAELPTPVKRAVAIDPSGGGSDEAGITAGFRGSDGRVYVTDDRSAVMSAAKWARAAWLLAVDTEADDVVWEQNLAGPTMKAQLRDAWKRLQRQARALRKYGSAPAAALELARSDAGGEQPDDDAVAELLAELEELQDPAHPERLAVILRTPDSGPARLVAVSATTGKRTRATPVAAQYETGRMAHVGFLPELEQQMTTWQEGQDSPDRMDSVVWLGTHLGVGVASRPARARTPSAATIPRGPAARGR